MALLILRPGRIWRQVLAPQVFVHRQRRRHTSGDVRRGRQIGLPDSVLGDKTVNVSADNSAQIRATDLKLATDTSTLVQSQGNVTLSASETGGGVVIVAPSLTSRTNSVSVSGSDVTSVQSGGVLKLFSSAASSNTGSVVLSATSADGVVNLEAGASLETSAGSMNIRATREAGILLETSAAEGNSGSLTLSTAQDVNVSAMNAAQLSATDLEVYSDASTLVQSLGTVALSASESGGGVDIVSTTLTSKTTAVTVSGSEDVSVQSGEALKISSSAAASDTGSILLSAADGVVNFEAGASLESSAGSTSIRATSDAGILLETSAAEGNSGSLTLSSAKDVDMIADSAAHLSASDLKLASDTSTLVQSQGTVALSASQSGGGVNIVATTLTSKTTSSVSMSGSEDVSVKSGGSLQLSSSAAALDKGSVVLSATSADGVVNLEAVARLEASTGSTNIRATREAGILLVTSAMEGNSGSVSLSSAKDIDMTADNTAQINASSLKLASDTSTLVQSQDTVALSASESGGGVDIVATSLTSKTTAVFVFGSEDVSMQADGALQLSSSAAALDKGSVVLSATSADGVVNLEAVARLEASTGSTNIRATREAGILLVTSAMEGNSGSVSLSSAKDIRHDC